ncbi:hypothetical protein AVEN_78757-1 [Araneus ventricosus]|uniref:Uncharacterized protein n=1 Tax=Araneus ventricosus TaxID=182803 RepID=A0A4Y2NR89_ARAVE|nr:hypothetical protein AVEN_78757-1 [Araneus ventricosus]
MFVVAVPPDGETRPNHHQGKENPLIYPATSNPHTLGDPGGYGDCQEIRDELDATSTSLFELSSHDLSRVDPPADSDVAFSANMTDSKLIDHLDLLFYADRSSMLSAELKEAWNDFKRRPCRDTLFIRTCMILEVLLPDKSSSIPRRRVRRDNPQRGNLSRRSQRRIDWLVWF